MTSKLVRYWIVCCLFIVLNALSLAPVQGQVVERTIEFRDKTILRVKIPDQEIPWRNVARDGTITNRPVQLSDVKRLVFATEPATIQVAEVRRLLSALGSASFIERERAQDELTKRGAEFIDILNAYQTEDKEVLWRLNHVKEKLERERLNKSVIKNQFDLLALEDDQERLDGDTGDWKLEFEYKGLKLSLDRETVSEIHDQAPTLEYEDTGESLSAVRSTEPPESVEGEMRIGYTRIDFDFDTSENETKTKQIVDDLYISKGIKFRSVDGGEGVPASNVGVFRYNCGGRSEKRCAANVSPAYNGTIELTFCAANKPNFPAGVHYVGFFTSAVKPDGTVMRAYNAYGQQIKEIKTVQSQSDYLGIESSELIARVTIVPMVDIDPDFAIDDVYFDTPRPLLEGGDPEVNTIVLRSGDRIQCEIVQVKDGNFLLEELTFSPESKISIPLSEVAVFTPSKIPQVEEDGTLVETKKGDIIRVKIEDQQINPVRFMKDIKLSEVTSIWSTQGGRAILSADSKIPENGAVLLLESGPLTLNDVSLDADWIKAKQLEERKDLVFNFKNTPAICFGTKEIASENAGILRTTNGEVYRLSDKLESFATLTEDAVEIQKWGTPLKIPYSEINSLRFPRK